MASSNANQYMPPPPPNEPSQARPEQPYYSTTYFPPPSQHGASHPSHIHSSSSNTYFLPPPEPRTPPNAPPQFSYDPSTYQSNSITRRNAPSPLPLAQSGPTQSTLSEPFAQSSRSPSYYSGPLPQRRTPSGSPATTPSYPQQSPAYSNRTRAMTLQPLGLTQSSHHITISPPLNSAPTSPRAPPSYQTAIATPPITTPSISASSSSSQRTQFASMSLHSTDHIRFLRFPSTIIPLIRATILSTWSRGIQNEVTTSGLADFKLKGNPWGLFSTESKIIRSALGDSADEQAVQSRRLVCSLLAALHEEGWMLMMSTDVSKAQWDSDTLIFRYQSPAPAAMEWFSVAFSANNKLRFIDAPSHIPLKVVQRLSKSKMECKCKEHRVEGCYEVKIQGMGWGQHSAEGIKVRGLVLDMLDVFEEEGWTIYASVDQKVGGESSGGGDTDTWHCCRPRGWFSGMPVYHN